MVDPFASRHRGEMVWRCAATVALGTDYEMWGNETEIGISTLQNTGLFGMI